MKLRNIRSKRAQEAYLPTGDNRKAKLQVILDDIGPDCQRCKLAKQGRKQIVFGTGDPHAELMFVGEGPGADEDEQGLPFVGRAGQLLNNMITAMGLKREQVYIANMVKCRPPGNRTPERDECDTCSPFLMRQIRVVRPKVIVALGATAAKNLLGMSDSMASLRGRFYDFSPPRAAERTEPFDTKLAVTYHPAFLLRDPRQKAETWKDLQMVMKYLGLQPPAKAEHRRQLARHATLLRCGRAGSAGRHIYLLHSRRVAEPCVGGRVIVPFREKRLCGIVTELHDREPSFKAKPVQQVLDTAPALTPELMQLGRWIAQYYIAPIGEVLRTMLPLSAEFRRATGYHITDKGLEALHAASTIGSSLRARRNRTADAGVRGAESPGRRRSDARGVAALGGRGVRAGIAGLLRKKWIAREDLSGVRDASRNIQIATLKMSRASSTPISRPLWTTCSCRQDSGRTSRRCANLAVPRTTLQTLVRRGIVEISEEPAASACRA